MAEVYLQIRRSLTPEYTHGEDEKERKELHTQRAELLHKIADDLGLDVKDWGDTDSSHAYEDVHLWLEIAAAGLGTLAALIELLRALLEKHENGPKRGIDRVFFTTTPKGLKFFEVTGETTPAEIAELARTLGLSDDNTRKSKTNKSPTQKKKSQKRMQQ